MKSDCYLSVFNRAVTIVICCCSIGRRRLLFVAVKSGGDNSYLLLFNRMVTIVICCCSIGWWQCFLSLFNRMVTIVICRCSIEHLLLFNRIVTIVIRLCSIEQLLMSNRTVTIVAPFVLIGLLNSWKDFFNFSHLVIQVRIGTNTPGLSYKNDLMLRPIEWDCKTEVLGHSSYRTINTNSCSKAIRSRKSPGFCSPLRKQVIQSIKQSFSCLEDT